MKKFILLPILALLAVPAFANTTETTTRTYESSTVAPSMSDDSEMIEAQEEANYEDENLDSEDVEQERMEDNDSIDYSDRTRTNRERKAINTGSDASDDH
jgi:hypothetical protein